MKELCQNIIKAVEVFECFGEAGILGNEDYKNFHTKAIVAEIQELLDQL